MPGTACPRSAIIRAGIMEHWSNGVVQLRTLLKHSITPSLHHSSNESPMSQKGPINKQATTDYIFDRTRSSVASVVTVVAVVTHGEITVGSHFVGLIGFRQIVVAGCITAIRRPCRHHPFKTVA